MKPAKERPVQVPWTPEEFATLEKMHGENHGWPEIAQACGHTKRSCQTTLSRLRRDRLIGKTPVTGHFGWSPAQDAEMIHLREIEKLVWSSVDNRLGRSLGSSQSRYSRLLAAAGREVQTRGRPDPALLRERDSYKRLEHSTLTAAFFGDPLPGRSALDERRLKEAGQ